MRKSVNDYVREQHKALRASPKLSKADLDRLDLHSSSIRDTEKAIAGSLPQTKIDAMKANSNEKVYQNDLPTIAKLHMDLIGIAIRTARGYGLHPDRRR